MAPAPTPISLVPSSPWLRNAWYVLAWSQDVADGQLVHRTVCDEPIVVFRSGGRVGALADQCSHRQAPLSLGRVCVGDGGPGPDGDGAVSVECPYHGLRFDAKGRCVLNPHGGRLGERLDIAAYPVVERHTLIWVWLGDRQPDESLIPDFSYLDPGAPGIVSNREMLMMDVDYRLVIDNLLDLSHTTFLHRDVLGNDATLDAAIEILEDGDTLHLRRLSENIPPPELFDLIFRHDGEPVNLWSEMRWNAPANLRHDAGVHEPGSRRESGVTLRGTHLITPSTASTCYYHVAAVRISDSPSPVDSDTDLAALLSAKRRHAFEHEDKPILEAQQRAHDRAGPGGIEPVMLSIDKGPLRARRILERLIADEAGADGDAEAAAATADESAAGATPAATAV